MFIPQSRERVEIQMISNRQVMMNSAALRKSIESHDSLKVLFKRGDIFPEWCLTVCS